jgi:cystathionine beta-lyase
VKKATQCVHAGTIHDPISRGINSPIYTSSSYEYLNRDECPYPRYFNTPNQDAVVEKLCALEHAEAGVLFASGMAAISTAILSFASQGDHAILLDSLYGGTHAFATDVFDRLGIGYTFVVTSLVSIMAAATDKTAVIVIESPTNPLMEIIDIKKVTDFAKASGITTIMDNTFASPILQTPIDLGVDIVVHSVTKYLGGHSDLCCGAALSSAKRALAIRKTARHLGGSLNAESCALLERSLKTLALRVERQTANCIKIAQFLNGNRAVKSVHYPGLSSSAGHDIAKKQMSGFGAMLSFELRKDIVSSKEFLSRLKMIRPAVSLGGVETIICAPAETSHVKMSAEERKRVGISDELLRLSVGIEDVDDLIGDLALAFGV